MQVKEGAKIDKTSSNMMYAALIIDSICTDMGIGCVITSGDEGKAGDGVHKRTSRHYDGEAMDFRTRELNYVKSKDFESRVRVRLDKDFPFQYDVVLETDHLHVEHDPE